MAICQLPAVELSGFCSEGATVDAKVLGLLYIVFIGYFIVFIFF